MKFLSAEKTISFHRAGQLPSAGWHKPGTPRSASDQTLTRTVGLRSAGQGPAGRVCATSAEPASVAGRRARRQLAKVPSESSQWSLMSAFASEPVPNIDAAGASSPIPIDQPPPPTQTGRLYRGAGAASVAPPSRMARRADADLNSNMQRLVGAPNAWNAYPASAEPIKRPSKVATRHRIRLGHPKFRVKSGAGRRNRSPPPPTNRRPEDNPIEPPGIRISLARRIRPAAIVLRFFYVCIQVYSVRFAPAEHSHTERNRPENSFP